MADIAYEDALHGHCIVTFDGRVLELFTERFGSVDRLIAGLLYIDVNGPNRRGHREVRFSCGPQGKGGGFRLTVPEDRWPAVEGFVREVAAAVG